MLVHLAPIRKHRKGGETMNSDIIIQLTSRIKSSSTRLRVEWRLRQQPTTKP
jgi:hypothetical protein